MLRIKKGGMAMKILLVVMIVKAIIAFLETAKGKNAKEGRHNAADATIQHPAENMLRW